MEVASVWSFKVLAVHPSLSGKPVKHVIGAPISPSTIARMLPGHDVEHWPLSGVLLHDPSMGCNPAEVLAEIIQAARNREQSSACRGNTEG